MLALSESQTRDAVDLSEIAGSADLRGQVNELVLRLGQEVNNNELLQESITDLQRALWEPGWIQLTGSAAQEFAPEGLRQMRAICRLYAIKNPLIKRGLGLRSSYVWGQGVEITARANGKRDGEQDVQAVVSSFLGDPGNERTLTGAAARDQLETFGLGCDGEVFIACFTRPSTGFVRARILPADEIADIISDPEDAATPWYYLRRWIHNGRDAHGHLVQEQREVLYPALDYRPKSKPGTWGRYRVDWSAPVLHVPVNQPLGWQHGIPDAYAAVDWAKAYKEFLEDWARLMRALARYAWKATTPGRSRQAVRARIAAAPPRDPATGDVQHAGATALLSPETQLEAVSKSGATLDSDSGRPLAAMVGAALDVPVTMLLGDPGVSGARATAETLDEPTRLAMGERRELWADVYRRILAYVITESVRAPKGPLRGALTPDPYSGADTLILAGDTDPTIDVDWPAFEDVDAEGMVKAIVAASGTGTLPPEQIARLLLTALGVRHVDELLEALLDDDGRYLWPDAPPVRGGSPAGDAARSGGDPVDTGPGPMDPGTDPDEPTDGE